jgi:hypothetical protein
MKRSIAIGVLATSLLPLMATPAAAGGNWIEFRREQGAAVPGDASGGVPARDARFGWDIFVTGETVVARVTYLSRVFDDTDGPFHLWIERGDPLEAGEPIPTTALRVGTFDMNRNAGASTRFVVPDLPRGTYTFVVCDDPCTTYGFGEYVQGWLTAVPTAAEAELLARVREVRDNARMRLYEMRRNRRQTQRREWKLDGRVTALTSELKSAREQLARQAAARQAARPQALIDGAGGAWIASASIAIAVAWLRSRRRRGIVVPDTPAELMPLEPEAARAVRSERVLEDLDI